MANLITTTETPKLKINTTVTHSEVVEKQIDLPYYFKADSNHVCKLVSSDYFILVNTGKNYWSIETYPTQSWKEKIVSGTPITEFEFEAAYSKAMMCVEAIYKNEDPSNEIDENVQIDEILEKQAS